MALANTRFSLSLLLVCTLIPFITIAQVGINTTTPNGILDVNSTTSGVVLPRVSLTSTAVASPVVDPQGVGLAAGTTVYNTNTTSNGTNDVTPGIYVWDGSKWDAQFERRQAQLFEQSSVGSARSVNGSNTIAGLNNVNFTPEYTGTYKLELRVNYGGGGAKVPKTSGGSPSSRSDGKLNVALQSGIFTLNFDGTNYTVPAAAYSTAYESGVGGTNYFVIWQEYYIVRYITMTEGDTKNFTLTFNQNVGTEFIDNGNSGTGRGYIGYDLPCSVELTYLGSN